MGDTGRSSAETCKAKLPHPDSSPPRDEAPGLPRWAPQNRQTSGHSGTLWNIKKARKGPCGLAHLKQVSWCGRHWGGPIAQCGEGPVGARGPSWPNISIPVVGHSRHSALQNASGAAVCYAPEVLRNSSPRWLTLLCSWKKPVHPKSPN